MRPQTGEFAPYYQRYIDKAPEGDVVQLLIDQKQQMLDFLKSLPVEKWDYRYAEGKWSIKEVLLHLIDSERIFTYRALGVARNDQTSFPGFDQDAYVPESNADGRSVDSLLAEYAAVREASIQLFANFNEEIYKRIGKANNTPISVRALAYISAGHELHHLNIIKERYL
ncbi:MAG: DinB family protein [Saprospiraceae bacterium]|nr:DinB family protein [Saprospiraceae bacterium]